MRHDPVVEVDIVLKHKKTNVNFTTGFSPRSENGIK
jgi:hypothetical protein